MLEPAELFGDNDPELWHDLYRAELSAAVGQPIALPDTEGTRVFLAAARAAQEATTAMVESFNTMWPGGIH